MIDEKMVHLRLNKEYEPQDYSAVLGCEDIGTKCIEILTDPYALIKFYFDLSKNQLICEPILQVFSLILLPRLQLKLPLNSKYSDRLFADAMLNSSVVNLIFEFLPTTFKERFIASNPFSGFGQFIAFNDISLKEKDKTLSLLNPIGSHYNFAYQIKVTTLQSALGILLEDDHSINDDLGDRKLPAYTQQRPNQTTINLIGALGEYFTKHGYGSFHYHQLAVIFECIAYIKRFYRYYWRVDVEDVLEAWFFINCFKKPRPSLNKSSKKILDYIFTQNKEGNFPAQRKIIKKTGLSVKVVSNAIGLKIKRPEGSGKLIIQGYVEYDFDEKGYKLTQLGDLALSNDFYVTVDGRTYQPKSILEEIEC